jgi:N-acetylglucosaminyldiphosphoundecaprenol N-acetyl-beta-D-mannosaminyltransferase
MTVELNPHCTFRCCGVRVDAVTMDDAVDRLRAFSEAGGGRIVHLSNAWTLALAHKDGALSEILNHGDLNLPDGTPLTRARRRAGVTYLRQRVCGADLLLGTAKAGRAWGMRQYRCGSSPEVAEAPARRLADLTPGVKVVGVESPPFRPLAEPEEAEVVERIRRARPDVVWIGQGMPRQDLLVERFCDRLDTTLVAVGAAFDFLDGTKRRVPTWMQDRGLEWTFRLATEPSRLWRLYLLGNTRFLRASWRQLRGLW